jgi:uncharacterized protein (DUF736 family)
MPRDPNEIGALWLKKSAKGTAFLSGKINGQNVVVFKNKSKKEGDKQPDYRVLLSQPREKQGETPPQREAGDDFGA